MEIAEIYVNGVTAVASRVKKVPEGIVGATVKVTFANEWADLAKTAVFQGVVTKDVFVDGNSITIPAECVEKSGYRLRVGFYGVADETLVIPTIWAELGKIQDATDPSGDTSTDPTLPVWAQLQKQIDNMTAPSDETIKEAVDKYLEKNPGVGTTGKDGEDGKDGVSATHRWDGTVLTITSASGTSSADLKGDTGATGPAGPQGETGQTGAAGTSVTVKSVSESTADGGSNVITFSDGKTITIKNGSKGNTGSTGATGAAGKTPVRGTDYWTEEDQEAIVQQVLDSIGQNVIGEVDSANNILITATIPNGTYTLKYENADGSVTDIGTLTVGGDDSTGSTYTNLADPTSSDWLTNQRINSSKNVVDVTEAQRGDKTVVVTNKISISGVSKLHIKGLDIVSDLVNGSSTQNYGRMYAYKDGAIYLVTYQPSAGLANQGGKLHYTYADYDSSVVIFDVATLLADWGYTDITQISFGGILTGAASDVIITADEKIV